MKRGMFLSMVVATLFMAGEAKAQILPGEQLPQGAIVYSLPSTTMRFDVEAQHESFVAGPYARYAKKYLGIDVRQESAEIYTLKSVTMTPYVEADRESNYAINLAGVKGATANFLEMTSQGLIVWSDARAGVESKMRFSKMADPAIFDKAASTSNLTSEKTTLYKTVQGSAGMERVPVQQSQVVEKSPERRAEEIASMIFKLRNRRMDIITGETDATFSGEAMAAAVKEINRLEEEYLSLFTGKSVYATQKSSFDVVPKAGDSKQLYVAFRFSQSEGILPPNNVAGRAVVLELTDDNPQSNNINMDNSSSRTKVIFYRKPAIMTARLIDGQDELLSTRVPVYQLGRTLTFPIEIAVAR